MWCVESSELVKKAKLGDKEALVQLIMDKKSDYYKLAYVYMGNKEDALDAMQDMIVVLYENISSLKKEDAFYNWSKTILVNCCKKHLKNKSEIIPLDTLTEGSRDGTKIQGKKNEEAYVYDGGFSEREDSIILEKHLSRLNEKHQEVLRLRYFLDLDNQTISNIIKVPVGTVKSRIFIGLKKLKKSLEGENL